MAPKRMAEESIPQRVAAYGCRLPEKLPPGEILTDITKKSWRIGEPIGSGGFGDIYLASSDIKKPVGQKAKYVIKIEPHNNGPLFVEMNFYIRAAKAEMIEDWCESQNLRQVGIPTYEGSGSHHFNGARYRFLVIPRYGIDVDKIFRSNGRKLSKKIISSLSVQMLYALEYIHSKGYAHSDVKGCNILLKKTSSDINNIDIEKTPAYLVDYGLAYRFRNSNNVHKPFEHDERRAHEGTLVYTCRDAHHGTHSRRGDLETLGYNILQWMCGRLPWEQEEGDLPANTDPEKIHEQKEYYMKNIDLFMKKCFGTKNIPENISNYMKYIVSLKFETRPDYSYLRSLFRENLNFQKLFGKRFSYANENSVVSAAQKSLNLRERRPCKPVNGEMRITRSTSQPLLQRMNSDEDFSWESVLACHPDKIARITAQIPSSSLTPPPSPTPPCIPTYAMLAVMQKMKDRQNGTLKQKSSNNDLRPRWMTPAMEEIYERKFASNVAMIQELNAKLGFRATRSRTAQKRKNQTARKAPQTESKPSSKKRKLSY
ncbi:hypothetical protein TKK_0012054 [Trichogramma kaykai]